MMRPFWTHLFGSGASQPSAASMSNNHFHLSVPTCGRVWRFTPPPPPPPPQPPPPTATTTTTQPRPSAVTTRRFISRLRALLCAASFSLKDTLVCVSERCSVLKTAKYAVFLDAVYASMLMILTELQQPVGGVSSSDDALAFALAATITSVDGHSFMTLARRLTHARAFEPPSSTASSSFVWTAACACFHAMSEDTAAAVAEKTVELLRDTDDRCSTTTSGECLYRLAYLAVSSRTRAGALFVLSNASVLEAACSTCEHKDGIADIATIFPTILDLFSFSPSGLLHLSPTGDEYAELLLKVGHSFCRRACRVKIHSLRRFVAIEHDDDFCGATTTLLAQLNVALEPVLESLEGPLRLPSSPSSPSSSSPSSSSSSPSPSPSSSQSPSSSSPSSPSPSSPSTPGRRRRRRRRATTNAATTNAAAISASFRRRVVSAIRDASRIRVCVYPVQQVSLAAWLSTRDGRLVLFGRTFATCLDVDEQVACFDFEDDLRRALKEAAAADANHQCTRGAPGRLKRDLFSFPTLDIQTQRALNTNNSQKQKNTMVLCSTVHTPLNGHVSVSVVAH